ncbi:MAG: hypothetical protein ACOYVE_00425 [Melioribacter sp.]|uniref:hypothetical protein n=1 Tax=Melioribacter sp. TaxID=2052167 RepID=UPI003BE5E75D
MKLKSFIIIIVFTLPASGVNAQTFGFGCLGLSGFYAGFTHHYYEAPALNEFVNTYKITADPAEGLVPNIDFKRSTGYRIGANIFRARFSSIFISTKGYYQFLKETHEYKISVLNSERYELSMNNWGVGLDIGIPVFSFLDLKLVEGHVNFYSPEFKINLVEQNSATVELNKFTSDETKIGYFLGSGLIIHLIPDYISLEATAGYNFWELEQLYDGDNNLSIPVTNSTNEIINKKTFSATLQINVGFPL